MNDAYINTVRLLLDIAPYVFESPSRFAMKGGTALNLFVQDMPRLSVDIDVVFTDHTLPRDQALATIGQELAAAKTRVEKLGYAADVRQNKNGDEAKMFVTSPDAQVKVEVNFVFRGTVMPVVQRSLTPATQELFGMEVALPLLDVPELYGSKLVAALDRQHPRDIYDVQNMFEKFEGIPDTFIDCFVAYLAGHNRPVHEVLFAQPQPLQPSFENEFQGMTREDISLESLEASRSMRHACSTRTPPGPGAGAPRKAKTLLALSLVSSASFVSQALTSTGGLATDFLTSIFHSASAELGMSRRMRARRCDSSRFHARPWPRPMGPSTT